jgi:ribA/ribD-fused uncharacterized protein
MAELKNKFAELIEEDEDPSNLKKRTTSQRSSTSDAEGDAAQPTPKKQFVKANITLPNDDAPSREWYKFMSGQIIKANQSIEELKETVEFATKQAEKAIAMSTTLSAKLSTIELNLDNCRCENLKLRKELIETNEKLIRQECYQRRDNLIFDGIAESKNETDFDCYTKIVHELRKIDAINSYADSMKISRCHRLGPFLPGRTRGIICHIHWYGDRSLILDHRMELNGSVTVREDFPPEIEQRRKLLYPILKVARVKYPGKCKLAVDKLVIEGRTYTAGAYGNLDQLPPDLDPIKVSQKNDDSVTVYFGQNHPFSNNYERGFVLDNIKYNSAEQYIQSEKCKMFNDDIGHAKVMKCRNSWEIRQVGSRVRNYIPQQWSLAVSRIAHTAVRAKFKQNPDLKTILLATNENVLGEASRDKLWGIGRVLYDKHVLQQQGWNGENVMGKVLAKVRSELKNT